MKHWLDTIISCKLLISGQNILGFPCGSAGKESAYNAGDLGSIPGLGRSPGEGKGYPLQYSGLQNSMACIVPRVVKSQTRLSDFHLLHLTNIKRQWKLLTSHFPGTAEGQCHHSGDPWTRKAQRMGPLGTVPDPLSPFTEHTERFCSPASLHRDFHRTKIPTCI